MRVRKPTSALLTLGMMAWAAVTCPGPTSSGGPPDADPGRRPWSLEEFKLVRKLVRPLPGENLWDRVRWVATLWEAQERAAREGKPIVVFTTGGEPLGVC